jgi:hypothetical protein
MFVVDRSWWIFVRSEPGEHERNLLAFADRELGDGSEVLAARFNWRSQDQAIRSSDRFQPAMTLAHPWHDLSVIKPNDQFHLHRHFSAQSFHDADNVRILPARRHEIDKAHGAALGFDFCFENKRVATVTATRRFDLFLREKSPVTVFRVAQERGEARRGIKPWKTKPINASVPAHQRTGLRITEKRVVLDLCFFLRHLLSSASFASHSYSCS